MTVAIGKLAKRVFDLVASATLLVLLSPVLLGVAVLVRLRMGSPVLFRQSRPGLGARPFVLLKFRTMIDRFDHAGKPLSDAERLTGLGRFLRASSIDELPELLNVLRGEMSLVGPRPLLTQYLARYTPEQAHRHDAVPGITGWAQINGRNELSWERKFELDLWYVTNRGFFLDLLILFRTAAQVLLRRGISARGHATMPEFRRAVSVIGAGGHAKVVVGALRASGAAIDRIYDDDSSKWGQKLLGIEIAGPISRISEIPQARAVIAIGSNDTRQALASRVKAEWVSVIHPSATVDPTATIGAGSVVFAGAVIQADASIGPHAVVNTAASIDHDCRVGAFAHIAPGVRLAGSVEIGQGCLIGIGSQALPGTRVGEWTVVGAGSTVTADLPARAVAYGTPAVPRNNEDLKRKAG